jgi:hypothetical protein
MRLASWLIVGVMVAPPCLYNGYRPVHYAVNIAIASRWTIGQEKVGTAHLNQLSAIGANTGDTIGDLTVSSAFGPREKPCPTCSKQHNGVDLVAPVGTPVYAPASLDGRQTVRVSCHKDKQAGTVAVISADAYPGSTLKLFHLKDCRAGVHGERSIIALSGATGTVTGPHLHVEQLNGLGKHQAPSAGLLSWLVTGQVPKADGIAYGVLSDQDLTCAIGAAEGTRSPADCSKTDAYEGHIDPGNGAQNQGTFSYQHEAKNPEDADAKQLARLREVEQQAISSAANEGISLSKIEILSVLDQYNQAPEAALGSNGTLDRIIEARAESYKNPETGRLDAPGLGNDMTQVRADQARRTGAIAQALQRLGGQ